MEYQRAEQSAVAECAKNSGYEIQFDEFKILNKAAHFVKRIYKEALEIEKCIGNHNRGDR